MFERRRSLETGWCASAKLSVGFALLCIALPWPKACRQRRCPWKLEHRWQCGAEHHREGPSRDRKSMEIFQCHFVERTILYGSQPRLNFYRTRSTNTWLACNTDTLSPMNPLSLRQTGSCFHDVTNVPHVPERLDLMWPDAHEILDASSDWKSRNL